MTPISAPADAKLPSAHDYPIEGHWHHPPIRTGSARLTAWGIAGSAASLLCWLAVGVSCLLVLIPDDGPLSAIVGLVLFGGALHYLNVIRIGQSLRATDRDELLRDDQGRSVLLVELEVRAGRGAVARDRGVLGFSDGAMYFSGHSFSFLLGSQDVQKRWGFWQAATTPEARLLGVRHPSARITLKVSALGNSYRNWLEVHHMLRANLKWFHRSAPATVERQYPPLEPWDPEDAG